ncbi:MAG: hypothetical protein WAS21_26925 [Geminicoccaceae bacterium]
MVRLGALSGRGEILIGGAPRGHVRYAIDECHRGGLDGRTGTIIGDDALLRAIWEHAGDIQLRCAVGLVAIHMGSYVMERGSAVVTVGGAGIGLASIPAAA